MKQLLVLVYRLPMDLLAVLLLLGTVALALLLDRFENCRWLRPGVVCAGLLWAAVVLFATVCRQPDAEMPVPSLIPFHSYREAARLGKTELYRSNFMNVILFYPGGALLGCLLTEKRPAVLSAGAIFLLACFSVGIEVCQYSCALGNPEIDDVIHNTLGVLLGWLCLQGIRWYRNGKTAASAN